MIGVGGFDNEKDAFIYDNWNYGIFAYCLRGQCFWKLRELK